MRGGLLPSRRAVLTQATRAISGEAGAQLVQQPACVLFFFVLSKALWGGDSWRSRLLSPDPHIFMQVLHSVACRHCGVKQCG